MTKNQFQYDKNGQMYQYLVLAEHYPLEKIQKVIHQAFSPKEIHEFPYRLNYLLKDDCIECTVVADYIPIHTFQVDNQLECKSIALEWLLDYVNSD